MIQPDDDEGAQKLGHARFLAATAVQKSAICCHSMPLSAIQNGALNGAATDF
jgi:hypothetical protein